MSNAKNEGVILFLIFSGLIIAIASMVFSIKEHVFLIPVFIAIVGAAMAVVGIFLAISVLTSEAVVGGVNKYKNLSPETKEKVDKAAIVVGKKLCRATFETLREKDNKLGSFLKKINIE